MGTSPPKAMAMGSTICTSDSFCATGNGKRSGALDHWIALFGQVYGDQNMFVGHGAFLQGTAIDSVWLLSSG